MQVVALGELDRVDAVGARGAIEAGAVKRLVEAGRVHAGVQHHVDAGGAAGVLHRAEPLRAAVLVHELGLAVVIGVLEVEPHGSGAEQAADELLGLEPVAGLHVGRDGHLHGRRDAPHRREHLVRRDRVVVRVAERRGDRRARGGDRRMAEPGHEARRGHVPDVGEHQQLLRQVERSQAPPPGPRAATGPDPCCVLNQLRAGGRSEAAAA